MPYLMCAGSNASLQGAGLTRWGAICGEIQITDNELRSQCLIRDNLTWSMLFVRVTVNAAATNTVVTSRIGAAPGAMSITIAGGATGKFEDLVNSDALVSGSLVDVQRANGNGAVTYTVFGSTLTGNSHVFMAIGSGIAFGTAGSTRWYPLNGRLSEFGTEARAQYLFRAGTTLTHQRIHVFANTRADNTVFVSRINGGPGTLTNTVGAGATGGFEDAVNSDVIAIGDLVCTEVTLGGGAGSINISNTAYRSVSTSRQVFLGVVNDASTIVGGVTGYFTLEGAGQGYYAPAEASAQQDANFAFTARNAFVRIASNSLVGGNTTYRSRRNLGYGNLICTVGAGATGAFEDLVNADNNVAGDELDWEVITPVGAGNIRSTLTGFQLDQAGGAPAARPYNVGAVAMAMGG